MSSTAPDRADLSSSRRLPWHVPAVLAGMAALLLFLGLRPDQRLVERVVFEGAHRATPVALRHLVDIRNGTTLLGVDLERAEQGAAEHPWVRSATATRQFPDTVVIEVDEHEPMALLHRGDLYYVDRTGAVFLRARSDDLDYPVITGIDEALERAHPDLPKLVVRDALWLLDELDTRGLASRDAVSEVAFARSRGFTLHLGSGAELRFGPEGLDRQVGRLARLEAEGVRLDRPVVVDLAPERVAIVRPRGALETEG